MARERKHADNADKQKVYRERKAQALAAIRAEASAGYTDKELGQAARDLHEAMRYEVKTGNDEGGTLAGLLGETPADTLRSISRHLLPPIARPQ
jgi:hypothetical protein